jgi:hypothetical protein
LSHKIGLCNISGGTSTETEKLHGTNFTIEVKSVELVGAQDIPLLASKPNKNRIMLKLTPCM